MCFTGTKAPEYFGSHSESFGLKIPQELNVNGVFYFSAEKSSFNKLFVMLS